MEPKVSEMAEFKCGLIIPHSICQHLLSMARAHVHEYAYVCAWKEPEIDVDLLL